METHHPVLVAAKGACPPEDCGRPWGYADLKEILADPSHEQHQEMLDRLDLDNTSAFDSNALAVDRSRRKSPSTAQSEKPPSQPTRSYRQSWVRGPAQAERRRSSCDGPWRRDSCLSAVPPRHQREGDRGGPRA